MLSWAREAEMDILSVQVWYKWQMYGSRPLSFQIQLLFTESFAVCPLDYVQTEKYPWRIANPIVKTFWLQN